MVKVITYGTYDLLHYGHIRLLERAKELGDYLIVGVTAEDFDKTRGKINVQQSLMERVEAVRATGIADEIIIEEYEGQKIDDIKRYDVDIFTVGSDWEGHFDYLREYCKVVYLDRTQGISSSQLRTDKRELAVGMIGHNGLLEKFATESAYVNGLKVAGVCSENEKVLKELTKQSIKGYSSYDEMIENVDAVYIASLPQLHYKQIKAALESGKHVIFEAPLSLTRAQNEELYDLAKSQNLILMEAIKTAYSTAYSRLLLLAKTGAIGDIVSVDATCTSLREQELEQGLEKEENESFRQNSICAWGPTGLLPVFQILGNQYKSKNIVSWIKEGTENFDIFTKMDFVYPNAVASVKVGKGVKSEGQLIISGTKGYIYVPAPWWKTDYFEIRFEQAEKNKRYFYQLDGEGIRYELVIFLKSIEKGKDMSNIEQSISNEISSIIEDVVINKNYTKISV